MFTSISAFYYSFFDSLDMDRSSFNQIADKDRRRTALASHLLERDQTLYLIGTFGIAGGKLEEIQGEIISFLYV